MKNLAAIDTWHSYGYKLCTILGRFLYSYEAEFMQNIVMNKRFINKTCINFTFRLEMMFCRLLVITRGGLTDARAPGPWQTAGPLAMVTMASERSEQTPSRWGCRGGAL